MASVASGPIALLPIKPGYATSIMNGQKKVEFRKVRFSQRVGYVVVYASKPFQTIIGYFQIDHVDEDSPDALWIRYGPVGCIKEEDFKSYYGASRKGVAIGIGEVFRLRRPVPLSDLGPGLSPPQGFRYLSRKTFDRLRRLT